MTTRAPDWDGTAYHRLSAPQHAWGQRVLARLPLRGDETVIDAGCGSGRLTAELLERLPDGHVIALDQSPSMLAVAERELRPRFGDRVSFLAVDLLDLDLEQAADAVFSTATFHWVLDHPQLFTCLHRAVRPGGRLVAQCGGGRNIERIHTRALRLLDSPEFAPHVRHWTPPWEYASAEATRERLQAAGFTEVATSLEEALTVLDDPPTYREFLRTVIMRPFLAAIPDAAVQERLLDTMCAEAADDEPPWSLDYWRLNMAARRPPG
jgi:trans-aconitate methyltransferase